MRLSNKAYDVLKYIAMIALPAIGAFYAALAKIWGFPYANEIVGTITAFDLLLGALLQISTNNYNKENEQQAEETADE